MNNNENDFIRKLEQKFDDLFASIDDDDIDEEIEKLDNIIVLDDENGEGIEFEFLDLIEYHGEEYVVLLPTDDDANEVVILMVDNSADPDEESYVSVDDEDTLQTVFEIFKEKFKDEFNFVD